MKIILIITNNNRSIILYQLIRLYQCVLGKNQPGCGCGDGQIRLKLVYLAGKAK